MSDYLNVQTAGGLALRAKNREIAEALVHDLLKARESDARLEEELAEARKALRMCEEVIETNYRGYFDDKVFVGQQVALARQQENE